MIVLDTNVLSEIIRRTPAPQVVAWVDERAFSELAITAISVAELRAGVALLPHGKRRSQLTHTIDTVVAPFAGKVLPFDADSGSHYATVFAGCRMAGRPIAALDAQIAAICLQHSAVLATRNTRDFAGTRVTVVDPWTA